MTVFILVLTITQNTYTKDFNTQGTFFEPIPNVLTHKMKGIHSVKNGIYIPYTRIDLAVSNGIEITRIIQTYKNNTQKNLGYNFTLPLLPDTTITQFTLWDHGNRLPASIEERESAENAYKRITGDEAPEFNKDPGLVRKSGNLFNLRIFPITPNENKQMELVTHRRLSLEDDYFVIKIPVTKICKTTDDKQKKYESQSNDISVYITDQLPIQEIILSDPRFTKTNLGNNRWLIKGSFTNKDCKDITIQYKLKLKENTHAQPTYFTDNNDKFLLLRVLSKWSSIKSNEPKDLYYLGIWKNGYDFIQSAEKMDISALHLEFLAISSIIFYDRNQFFLGSYHNYKELTKDLKQSYIPKGIYIKKPFSFYSKSIPDKDILAEKWDGDGIKHLSDQLQKYKFKNVILFLDPLELIDYTKLKLLIKDHPKTTFLFIIKQDIPQDLKDLRNLSIFDVNSGWKQISHRTNPYKLINFLDELLPEDPLSLPQSFMQKVFKLADWLPNRDIYLPSYKTSIPGQLHNLRVYIPSTTEWNKPKHSKSTCIWITAQYPKPAETIVDLVYSTPPIIDQFFKKKNQTIKYFKTHFQLTLKAEDKENRFIGAYFAKHQIDELSRQINEIEQTGRFSRRNRRKKLSPEKARKIIDLKQQIVQLSKKYSFLTSETAFIALPEDLQKKYGYTKQQFDTGKLYNLKGIKKGGLPEPAEYLLLIMILFIALSVYFIRRYKRKRA